jgi:hypothetical protein
MSVQLGFIVRDVQQGYLVASYLGRIPKSMLLSFEETIADCPSLENVAAVYCVSNLSSNVLMVSLNIP